MVCLPELLVTCLLVWPTKGIPWKEEQVSLPTFWLVFRSSSALPTGPLLSPWVTTLNSPFPTGFSSLLMSEGLKIPCLPLVFPIWLNIPTWKPLLACKSILPSRGTQLTE